jgi:hypothetical protein
MSVPPPGTDADQAAATNDPLAASETFALARPGIASVTAPAPWGAAAAAIQRVILAPARAMATGRDRMWKTFVIVFSMSSAPLGSQNLNRRPS